MNPRNPIVVEDMTLSQDGPYLGSIYEGLRVVYAEDVVKHPGQLKRGSAHRTADIQRQRLPALSGEVPQGFAVLLAQLGAAGREPQRLLWAHGNKTERRYEGAWHQSAWKRRQFKAVCVQGGVWLSLPGAPTLGPLA